MRPARFLHLVARGGDASGHPENTLPAFQSALDLGVRFVEVDVQLSANGVRRFTVVGYVTRTSERDNLRDLDHISFKVRRLGLLKAEPGVAHRISAAWVLVPSLEVIQADQIYTPLGDNRIRYASETFSADLTVDDEGFVVDYPGLARLVQ